MANLVMYLRLSVEDDVNADESNSITNQRRIIREYISSHDDLRDMSVIEKCDDGYSGTSMNRPAMQELLELVKEQKVSCIIVKDMSRFARNYLETGKYIEQVFPFMGIRFISINDNYDSNEFVGGIADIDMQFKALLYDFYSKDLSEKVLTAVNARKDKGMFIGVCAPFGYRKSKENAYEIEVDEEAAGIVRTIFSLRLQGESISAIVRYLNDNDIDTPARYLENNKLYGKFYSKGEHPLWTPYKVNAILNNEMYMGTFVYGKYRVKAVGSKQKKLLPQDEWKRIPNHHKPIVTKEEFEQVQTMKSAKLEQFTFRGQRSSVYVGRVHCDCCGRNMCYKKDRLGKEFFHCDVSYRKKNNCVQRVLVSDLDAIIKGELEKQMTGLANFQVLLDKENKQHQERVRKAVQHLSMAEDTLRRLEFDLRTAYESYVKGITDKDTYLMQKESYDVMISGIKEKIKTQKEAVIAIESQKPGDCSGLRILEGKTEIVEITDELLDVLLEEIVVRADKTIELRWKFHNRSN